MPAVASLPAQSVTIRYPPSNPDIIEETYQLLELPVEILKRVEAGSEPLPLTIKGRPNDDAVLCTPDSTFLLRTVSVSNSLLVLRPPPADAATEPSASSSSARPTLQIRDVRHEVLECVPQAPVTGRIRKLLRASAWDGMGDARTAAGVDSLGKRKRDSGGKRYTRAQLESVIQASDAELVRALRENNVVEIDGRMLLLPARPLQPLLSIVLTLLTIHATASDLAADSPSVHVPVEEVAGALCEHDVCASLAHAVLDLFGRSEGGEWVCDVRRVVQHVGLGLLAALSPMEKFMDEWTAQSGDYSSLCDLALLNGEHLRVPGATARAPELIMPFSTHDLPLHAATRFGDLFLTQARWRPDDMAPFLRGLTREGDTKERDKLIAKFVRVVKEKEGTWWYPRRTA